ncbi:MAG: hypothetical protein J0L73_25760 [Verrucomicrobia bacterium]|nr:hypothetical protein [Verrucomicrobiota bacterium]
MVQKIFMLEPSPGSRIPKFVTATDAAGKSLFEDGPLQSLPEIGHLDVPSGVEKMDRLLTTGNELVLSEDACAVLARCSVDPQVIRCPLRIKPAIVGTSWGNYALWHATRRHAILHESASVRSIKGHVLSVYEWSVASSCLPSFDLFLGPTNRWFASEKLVDAVFERRLSGFGFAVIPCF